MRIKYLFVFVFCMVITPFMVHADCNYERTAELSKLASNVNFSYTYMIEKDNIKYTVNAINIANDIYVKDNQSGIISKGSEFNFNLQ